METSLIVALISSAIAVISLLFNFITVRKIEQLKFKFQEKLSEKNARRDYEYEARKKLYQEYEPIFFKLSEDSESLLSRIYGLVRSTKDGKLTPQKGWLSGDDYYLRSTIYKVFAPLASYRIMKENINSVDLRLDQDISIQYILAKIMYRIYSSDFEFARCEPQIDYNATNSSMYSELGNDNPQKFWRQGMAAGNLDQFIETIIIKDSNKKKRIMDFGEFNEELENPESVLRKRFDYMSYLFLKFHPETRPVLWRMVITQAALCYILSKARFTKIEFTPAKVNTFLQEFEAKNQEKFIYYSQAENTDLESEKVRFRIAREYINKTLKKFLE